ANPTLCAPNATCVLSYQSDQIRALERVLVLAGAGNANRVAAVNLSLGSGQYTAACDTDNSTFKLAVDNLRSVGIATTVASGNEGYTNAISSPACVSTAVAVGSTTKADVVSSFTNRSSLLALLAPGSAITSAVPGVGTYAAFSGTSMAAPHVAGAWALLKSRSPGASVNDVLAALRNTGLAVQDAGSGLSFPRIRVDQAAAALASGSAAPGNVAVVVTGNAVQVSWAAPASGGTPVGYRVEFAQASTNTVVATVDLGLTTSYATTLPDGGYIARVRALTGSGAGPSSAEVSFTVGQPAGLPPTPPVDVRATVSGRSVTLAWNISTASPAPTKYIVEVGSAPGASDLVQYDTGSTARAITATGVGLGTYYARVRAANAGGTSAASPEVAFTIADAPTCTATPVPPAALAATVSGAFVSLHWTVTSLIQPVTGYLVEVGSAGGLADLATIPTGTTAPQFSATAPSGTYFVRVRAVNACGASVPSNDVVVVVP
ncbi:MAG: S8 family serine peptidase, partial [Vicinamibacterales bacterium]